MLSRRSFDGYRPGIDKFTNNVPVIRSYDLEPAFSGNPKLSIMISTYNRQNQLARSLECLARQEWKEFEVLVMDNGSTEDLSWVFELFEPYLQLRTFRREMEHWLSCPSRSFKEMLPNTKGDIICITHPEMMFRPDATKYIILGTHTENKLEDCYYRLLEKPYNFDPEWLWVTFKPAFIDENLYPFLDIIDWHSDIDNIHNIPGFWGDGLRGFSNRPNIWHYMKEGYPWWFSGAAKKDCPIWEDMPVIDGHGIIDIWMLNYRGTKNIVDVTPDKFMCYHQAHLTHAVAPEGELESEKLKIK